MYRAVIEHPQCIPTRRAKEDRCPGGSDAVESTGSCRGVACRGQASLGKSNSAELVSHLSHANAWWRLTAQRLLVERQDQAAIEPLREVVLETSTLGPRPTARALDTCRTVHVGRRVIDRALHDNEPGIRAHALRLAETGWASKSIREGVLKLADDSEGRVRFQAAFTLGSCATDSAIAALEGILVVATLPIAGSARLSSARFPSRAVKLLSLIANKHREFLARLLPPPWSFVRQLAGPSVPVMMRRKLRRRCAVVADAGPVPSRWQLAALAGSAAVFAAPWCHLRSPCRLPVPRRP